MITSAQTEMKFPRHTLPHTVPTDRPIDRFLARHVATTPSPTKKRRGRTTYHRVGRFCARATCRPTGQVLLMEAGWQKPS